MLHLVSFPGDPCRVLRNRNCLLPHVLILEEDDDDVASESAHNILAHGRG